MSWTNLYPTALNTPANMPNVGNGEIVSPSHQNAARDAMLALEAEVGINPGGASGSLRKRVLDLEAGGGGGWTPIGAAQEITGSPGSTLTFPSLSGNNFDEFEVKFRILFSAAPTVRDIILRPNGLQTDAAGSSESVFGANTRSALIVSVVNVDLCTGSARLRTRELAFGSATSSPRGMEGQCAIANDPPIIGGTTNIVNFGGMWNGTGEITSLELVIVMTSTTTLVSEFGVGTIAQLYGR